MSGNTAVGISVRNIIGVTLCQGCKGSGAAPSPERVIFAESLSSAQVSLLLASVCAPCEHCSGKGYVNDREIREQLAFIPATD